MMKITTGQEPVETDAVHWLAVDSTERYALAKPLLDVRKLHRPKA